MGHGTMGSSGLAVALILLIRATAAAGWNIALSVTAQVGGAVGGEPFAIQPAVTVTNKKGEPQPAFQGRMTVRTHASPDGRHGPVWKAGEATAVVAQDASGGHVAFAGLGLDAAGGGYRLEFALYDEHGLLMGTTVGDAFAVFVGARFRLGLVRPPATAYGGSAFGAQPVLAVQDRGGNTVADANEGTVAVVLESSNGAALRCTAEHGFTIPLKDGLASFRGLFINEAAPRYSLRFSTDAALDGPSDVASPVFSVGVGPAAALVLVADAADGPVAGGRAFAPQPRAEVRDAGGNALVDDSASAVRASFHSNPEGGALSPAHGTTVTLRRGVVQFRGLAIDRAGSNYRLTYDFLQFEEAQLKATSVSLDGSYFNVEIGPPHQLSILQHSSGRWSGNQPFLTQPKIALLDAGGNIVVGDTTSTVTAHVTPSLAHGSRVIIDTSHDEVPRVADVVFAQNIEDDARLTYGPGDVVHINVVFSQGVALFQTNDEGTLPRILLNVVDSGSSETSYGELVPLQEGTLSRTLSFEYIVRAGQSQLHLDYLSSEPSLFGNDYSIEDAFGRSADLALPAAGSSSSLSGSKTVGISDDQPVVDSIAANLPTGEYGAGDEVNFTVTLDRPVIVTGSPELPLNLRSAIYVHGSGSKHLTFTFKILPGDATGRLDVSNAVGAALLFPVPEDGVSLLMNAPGTSGINVDPNVEGISLPSDRVISIDTAPPSVVSIAPQGSTTPDGTYAVGDTLSFEIVFDKPVNVGIGLELLLNTESGVARYMYGSGTDTIVVQYTVREGDITANLEVASLESQNSEGGRSPVVGYVRRTSFSPTTDANLDISHITSMADNHIQLVIDGERPRMLEISFDENVKGKTFTRGDTLIIAVQFSAPVVVVNEALPPILGLLVGVNEQERWATYSSGSGSATVRFAYQVVVGDSSLPLELQYRTFCHQDEDCTDTRGLLVRLSETLELDADLNTGFSEQGIHIAESLDSGVTIDTSDAPVTTVVSATTSKAAGTYGVGEIVDLEVKFTDQVYLPGAMPALLLNTDNFASYYAGQKTDTLIFRYVSAEDDVTSKLDWALVLATESALSCTGPCVIENANGIAAGMRFHDLQHSIALIESLEPAIAFDPAPPQIVSVISDKTKSPYCHLSCTYTVGEEISIFVNFDRTVAVQGNEIYLAMDVGDGLKNVLAVYVPSMSTESELVFLYTVGHDHSSNDRSLNYVCSDSLCSLQPGDATEIKGAASIPTSVANLTLPHCLEHGLSGDESNPIIVDTNNRPTVIDVSSTTADGVYVSGDTIYISVQFSKTVVVSGEPFLTLEVGTPLAGVATYKDGSGTPILNFEYEVGLEHTTLDLDCNDAHSLYLGFKGVDSGSIKQASTNPSVDANIDLPVSARSLGANSNIQIDNRKPFVLLISAAPGEFSTGNTISIEVQFSRPVAVNGLPSLLLAEGSAEYESQPTDSTIEFSYIVQLGDTTQNLDYWSDEDLLPSSKMSFHLNGGWIKLKGMNPVLDADIHLNPVDGFLDGDKVVEVTEGVALFRDLKIGQRGKDFKIWFQSHVPSTGGELQVAEMVTVKAGVEYEVRGDLTNRDPGDLYGSAVSLHGKMLAVGAPGKLNPTSEIQVLTVFSEAAAKEQEVQIIATSVNKGEAVMSSQDFSTCANVGETIQGWFTLTYSIGGLYVFSRPIQFDAGGSSDQLKSVLEHELKLTGLVEVSRSINPSCLEVINSWTWSVTFLDSSEGVGVLETSGASLVGNGAHISQASSARNADMLRGSFQLVNPFNGLISRAIPYDASSRVVKDAIQEDLEIPVLNVQAENMDTDTGIADLGRQWTILFSHHEAEHGPDTNVPQLQALSDRLFGKDSHVWTHTGFEGRGILSGTFALSFRDSGPSYFVSHDSSEEELIAALESLDSVNKVSVSNRRIFSNEVGKSGCTWTITFDSVNKLTPYGWLLDPGGASSSGNLPSLKVSSHLIGWNAGYIVRSETGRGREDIQAQWMTQQKGNDGSRSGSVEIFRNIRENWKKEATVFASDYNANDAFGTSVSIVDTYLLIGAPSKEVDGLPEQQTMTCLGPASGGFFVVTFRGFKSSPIPHDSTLTDVKSVVGLYGSTDNIHTTPRLLFTGGSEGWDGISSGFCSGSNNSISITFLTPDGGGLSTVEKRSGDLELLTVDFSNLIGASVSVHEHGAGTVAPMGTDLNNSQPTGKQSGSAYLFQQHVACSYCQPMWTEIVKFTPMDGMDGPTDAAEFGWSSAFVSGADPTSNLAVIGSPGFSHGSGKVYIFTVVHGLWVLLDSLTDQNWNHEKTKGGRFGSSIDADSDTILIGSPGYSNGKGAVYVFRQSHKGKPYLASQVIYGPDGINPGDRFGHSLALSNNKAVLCAPFKTTDSIHLSMLGRQPRQAGACYVYSREDQFSAFKLDQQLTPSNVLSGDRFGWSVAMTSNRIVVGQVEEATYKIGPPRPVQVIKTFCKHPPCNNAAASKFRLQWIDTAHWTPFLSASTTANQLRGTIEASLLSGATSVSRSVLPDEDGGHTWIITFDSYNSIFRDVNKMPAVQCDVFVISSLSCETHIEHDIPQDIRGKAHLFDFDESSESWTEQSFLFSNAPQRQDLLASSVAIHGNFAVAGAPNRELLNSNSGAALVYDITFLDLDFPEGPYSLTEGDIVDIKIGRSSDDRQQLVAFRSMDSNGDDDLQHHVNELFSLRSLDLISHDRTPVGLLTSNSARGRSQYYGSDEKRSLFLCGLYDIQGVNDYQLLNYEGQLKRGELAVSTSLKITDDNILEIPNENVTLQFNLRGMFASQLGRLKADVYIADNGDGVSPEGNVQYQVLKHVDEELARTGAAVGIDRGAGMLAVGSDQTSHVDANGNSLKNVGSVSVFKRSSPGRSWDFMATLSPPIGEMQANMYFGQSVAINKQYGRDDITVLIGAPGTAAAFVYTFQQSTSSWILQAKLSATDATLSVEDRFGSRGALALHEDMAFVGSSSMESVYVFRRSNVADEVSWNGYSVLRSNDFDFDVYGAGFSIKHMHNQGFGMALAANGRTLLVGAPHADYGNRGNVNEREHFDTNGIHNNGLGKGKVYSFYSQPHVQIVTLKSDEKIAAGSFKLKLYNHQGVEEDISGYIANDPTSDLFKIALEKMTTVGEVNIEANEKIESTSYEMSWRISFLSNFADNHPLIVPQWYGNGCDDCEQFKVSVLSTVEPFMMATAMQSHQPYVQEGEMQPRDVTSTDLFGASIALDGPQAIIGSMHSAAKTRTTWDFETGDLQGWSATGTSWQHQPTYGDNSKFRAVYEGYGATAGKSSGESQSSRLEGRYYIGSYEKRPGVQDGNYEVPNQQSSLGSTQGDGPMGTLTSDPFIIRGKTISFLIGGGCNHLTSFIELLVDGYPSLRATGKCSEKMARVRWDVEMFNNRAGQIRIVDNGRGVWDHVNVDDIHISTDDGQCDKGGGALPKTNAKQHYTGREESPMAGAAYMFLYECEHMTFDDSSPSNSNCVWKEQERLVAGDKREGHLFGFSVDVDHEQGVAVVGSPNSPAYGFYQEPISVYPHSKSIIDLPIAEDLEDMMKSGTTYSATGGNIRLIDYLAHKGQIAVEEVSKFTEHAGAAYVFLREPARYGPSGEITHKPFWRNTEHSKVAPPDVAARDNFGFSVALDGTVATMGAVGRDGNANNQGGAYVYDMEWVRVKFTKVEFVALEGQRSVKIFVERDLLWSNLRYSIGYSASDLTAVGVDTIKFDKCMQNSPSPYRDGCGDYEQASGEVTFNEGEQHAYFTIRIMDDKCIEKHMEYAQLNLHQIGGSPLRGTPFRAQLRIDDDDFGSLPLSINCTGGIG